MDRQGIVHAAPAGRVGRLLQSDLTGDGKADVLVSFGNWGKGKDQYLFIMVEPHSLSPGPTKAAG